MKKDLGNIKTRNVKDMFKFWVKTKRFEYPGIRFVDNARKAVVTNRDEKKFLLFRIEMLEKENEVLEREDKDIMSFTPKTIKIFNNKKSIYDYRQQLKKLEKDPPNKVYTIAEYVQFREVIKAFNRKVVERLVEDGDSIGLGNGLGRLRIEKIKRVKTMPNWPDSIKYRKELQDAGVVTKDAEHPDGKKWIIFYDDDYYFRWGWVKNTTNKKTSGQKMYEFIPSRGMKGAKRKLASANRNNPVLHARYKHIGF